MDGTFISPSLSVFFSHPFLSSTQSLKNILKVFSLIIVWMYHAQDSWFQIQGLILANLVFFKINRRIRRARLWRECGEAKPGLDLGGGKTRFLT